MQEFHTCSEYAPFVHPYAAKELQTLFDAGVSLVDMMDAGAPPCAVVLSSVCSALM